MPTRAAFLSAFGAIYVCAFVSFWLQYPGLLGDDGLLPARAHWKRISDGASFSSLPSLLLFLPHEDVDVAIECFALAGTAIGVLVVSGLCQHGSLFALLYLLYHTLFLVGQTWLGFQWDLFLLETGFMAIFYAPWTTMSARREERRSGGGGSVGAFVHPFAWVLRVQWVKFMLMSGAVKVQARCPTWRELTALEYHFASTCLPTAEAWLMHSLHPFFLRCGVAFMFLCELVAPWLLLAPITPIRRVGVLVQVALQVGIFATGNYNWFNLHTVVLLLPAWAADVELDLVGRAAAARAFALFSPLVAWERLWATRLPGLVAKASATALLLYAANALFPVRLDASIDPMAGRELIARPDAIRIENRANEAFVRQMLDAALQPSTLGAYLYGCLVVSALAYTYAPLLLDRPQRGAAAAARWSRYAGVAWRGSVSLMAILLVGVTLLPLQSITNGRPVDGLVPAYGGLRTLTVRLHEGMRPLHASNSYGLFRRMTGVGERDKAAMQKGKYGWGGRLPSVVAVPVFVLEGHPQAADTDGVDGGGWVEIPFRYTPFGESRAPRRTAPHQPRLDWQMWFAALGDYQHNPWLLHLMYKVLVTRVEGATSAEEAAPPALALLDLDAYPFKGRPPMRVRAHLYHYDFTRVHSPWAKRIPGARMQPANCSWLGPYRFDSGGGAACRQWWRRTFVREYVGALDRRLLEEQVVKPQGWPIGRHKKRADPCRTRSSSDGRLPRLMCDAIVKARHAGAPLRRLVGFELGGAFVDGPLVIICSVVLVAAIVGRVAAYL